MTNKFLLTVFCILIILIFLLLGYFKLQIPKTNQDPQYLHYWQKPQQPVQKIDLTLFYFIPQNQSQDHLLNWQKKFEETKNQILQFHREQFPNSTKLTIDIYSQPIIGQDDLSYYLVSSEQGQKQMGIDLVISELQNKKIINNVKTDKNIVRAWMAVVANPNQEQLDIDGKKYVIAAYTNENRSLVSSWIFLKQERSISPASIIYHELMHILAVPEYYDPISRSVSSTDVMGLGRLHPIEDTYINQEVKKGLGYQ